MAALREQAPEDGLAIVAFVKKKLVVPINHVTAAPKRVLSVGILQTRGLHHD